MTSFQNLLLLQNFYKLKALGFEYCESFSINHRNSNKTLLSLDELKKEISICHLCDLSKSRSQSMGGFGNPNADLMFIDDHVSMSEDSSNGYFCGRSGEMLRDMIKNVLELDINDVYFTHAIKCKPLNANKPSSSEWDSCKSYLFSQINFVKPKIIVTLGREAYEKMTLDSQDFYSARGHVIDFKEYKLIPMFHPNHLLKNPNDKKIALMDLKTIKNLVQCH